MPRLVDHDQRRREITTVARRVIAQGGLDAATFQSIAAAAGISVRLIQYYFGTKADLLDATFRAVIENGGVRMAQRLGALGENPDPRDFVRAVATVVMPLDDEGHEDCLVLAAFHAAALEGSGLSVEERVGPVRWLIDAFAAQIRRYRDGKASDTAELDAQLIVVSVTGITQGVLGGAATREQAEQLLDRLLDRTMGA
ncbi:TetR/AcrR family transcriptional regulator [Nocardia huaxiensis]|uniref:TetR/AcrR family transcriptional regulator n=1 Tax=Nocardia huaxiensis TaxID=2755382 RepID=A0A7D6Z2A8_9NOCA|nr:TetR/AcrR family transcriptional regulator [Nocardia huaxiensis]QLY29064.1 TetR/AcrR family transcriptional regulator [Nocardia huaxiensis]UFS97449.1 TetR/AcrR family transcriptional regulator [Nocardia huaxiensis]